MTNLAYEHGNGRQIAIKHDFRVNLSTGVGHGIRGNLAE